MYIFFEYKEMKSKMSKMVWYYVDRWLRNMVESENISTKRNEGFLVRQKSLWEIISQWWRPNVLPVYEKKHF